MLTTLAVAGYRSLRSVVLPLAELNVVTGANGSGKSNLYRALRLLGEAAHGRVVAALAAEGGLGSTMWAGPERTEPSWRAGQHRRGAGRGVPRKDEVALRLGFASEDLGYLFDLGYPTPSQRPTAFALDPVVKVELVFAGPMPRPGGQLVRRFGPAASLRSDEGDWRPVDTAVPDTDSVLTRLADPVQAPEVLTVRERIRSWRFYDAVRTDPQAPARVPRVGTFTPVLAADGADLAAAVQTIVEIGRADLLAAAVDGAFAGARVDVADSDGRFVLRFHRPGLLRPLTAAELSDGTLRFLLWAAALLSPRPPELMVLNEPESSLHPDLLAALADLIVAAASEGMQTLVVTHSAELVQRLRGQGAAPIELYTQEGETRVRGQEGLLDRPGWNWPARG